MPDNPDHDADPPQTFVSVDLPVVPPGRLVYRDADGLTVRRVVGNPDFL